MAATRTLLGAVAVATLAIAACGGDDDAVEDATPSTTTTTEAAPETTTTTAGESDDSASEPEPTGDVTVDAEGVPVDYVTYGAGAFPVRYDPETQETLAAAVLDGLDGYKDIARSPTGPEEPVTITVELPAATTFAQFAVPPMSSFGCCFGTHAATVTVEGSSESPDDGFAPLVEFTVDAEEHDDDQRFAVDDAPPVRWLRVTLDGRQVPDPEDYRGTTFIELRGHGTQEDIVVADGTFTGRWLTGGGGSGEDGNRIELIQDGNLVTGCGIGGGASFTISGGIENGLLKYVVDADTVPTVGVINSEGELVGALIGRAFTRLVGVPGGSETPCTPGADAPANPVGDAIDECRAAIVYGINFDVDKADIRPDAEPSLTQILEALSARPDVSATIEGHTDSDGSDEYNADLSQRRADAVVAWLVDKGVGSGHLTAVGKGEAEPIADNESSAGKASNRRVEVEPTC